MPFSPSSLFGSGEFGYALDVLDGSKLWQDTAGTQTTPAVDTQPIGRIDDVSGNGNHFTVAAANASRRPVYDASDADNCPIDFDGSNDALVLASAGLFAAGVCTIVMRVKGAGQQNKHFLSEGHDTNTVACYSPGIATSNTAGSTGGRYFFANDAGTTILNTSSGVACFDNSVHTVIIEDNGSSILMTVDGVAGTSRSYTRSGATTLNRSAIGCLYRSTVQNPLAASMGRVIAINRALTSTEKTDASNWVANAATTLTGPVGRADETDASLALGSARPVGLATETETAFALAAVAIAATGTATESDLAIALAGARPAGRSDETDAALALTGVAVSATGEADEADVAVALAALQLAATGQADETDEAVELAAVAIQATGLASETDDAFALGVARPVDAADETDEALELSSGVSTPVGLASETDAAFSLGSAVPAGVASETDTALGLGVAVPVGLAAENDNAVQLLPREPVDIPDSQTTHADPRISTTHASPRLSVTKADRRFAV